MRGFLARNRASFAMAAVFLVVLLVAHVARPAEPQGPDETERLFGPNPPTDLADVEEPAGEREPGGPTRKPPPRTSGYTPVEVEDGATIRGVVRLAEKAEPWQVERGKDHQACGEAAPTERLIVGADGRTLKNCVVYLAGIGKGKAWTGDAAKGPDERAALLDQVRCAYVPHVLVIRTETQLQLKNSDEAEHNIHAYYRDYKTTQLNLMTAAQSFVPEAADAYIQEPGRYIVKCDIHPWMSGYVHAFRHPYWAVTGEDGVFEIDRVPPGTYTLVCWHEGMREEPQMGGGGGISSYEYGDDFEASIEVTVKAGETATHDFTVPNPK